MYSLHMINLLFFSIKLNIYHVCPDKVINLQSGSGKRKHHSRCVCVCVCRLTDYRLLSISKLERKLPITKHLTKVTPEEKSMANLRPRFFM